MSWNAQRYTPDNQERLEKRLERKAGRLDVITKHHVPPRHPDTRPRFIKSVDERHHRAYHLLFGAAATFEDAVEILKHDWWS